MIFSYTDRLLLRLRRPKRASSSPGIIALRNGTSDQNTATLSPADCKAAVAPIKSRGVQDF